MKSVLLHVAEDDGFESRLQAALDLARFGGGHVECLQTRRVPAFIGSDAIGMSGSASMIVQMMEEEDRIAANVRAGIEPRIVKEGLPFSWSEALGEPAQTLVDRSLLADVVVMSLPDSEHRNLGPALGSVVTRADAPVLAVPVGWERLALEKPVMVAWKPTSEAAASVKAALPLLAGASRVDILTIDPVGQGDFPPTAVASYLSRHGIKAEMHERHAGSQSTADTLSATAQELGAGLVVMGGYGRSRAMEFLLGGVTRRLLSASPLPLLMAH